MLPVQSFDKRGNELIVKDSEGTQLYIGDKIAYIRCNYNDIQRGTVQKINPKSVKVDGTTKFPSQILKI